MDIFEVHRRIVGDYANYIRSFVSISDEDLRQRVAQHLNDGHRFEVVYPVLPMDVLGLYVLLPEFQKA